MANIYRKGHRSGHSAELQLSISTSGPNACNDLTPPNGRCREEGTDVGGEGVHRKKDGESRTKEVSSTYIIRNAKFSYFPKRCKAKQNRQKTNK